MKTFITEIKTRILAGGEITYEEAVKLMAIDEKDEETIKALFDAANMIREKFVGNKADLCSIINAKSGMCSEDCKYCAQSIHYQTGVEVYDLLDYDEILKRALEMEREGVNRFSLVTSGKGIDQRDFDKLIKIYERLTRDTNLKICASHGIISYEQAVRLKIAGVNMYHHNVEASSSFYENICSTHTYEDRINTINNVQKAGLKLCCGGIIGLGEAVEDRVKMAFEIKNLGIKSVPINILNPIKGTPLENVDKLSPLEILKAMAIFRLIIPDGVIRYAGGRVSLGAMQHMGFKAGVNAALVGNYLTTVGNKIIDDIRMIKEQGFEL
ncbi:biotin synthase BioB [Crassaminicella indica]|uniref:Biotin synthase n=1 Tax=Crassaminicella indica TaxID=2855394 RepID=A0ABX8RFK1_9CLOT|nr:biotin synthase BioB [Crassaminicella indica]QXM07194.1 biotin synthase BioB [Crassaminicella indica]